MRAMLLALALLVACVPLVLAQAINIQGPPELPGAQMPRLAMPAEGRFVLSFGDKTQTGDISKGAGIVTLLGASIVAPSNGHIVYAGEFRGYGKLVIISAGEGYHLLLAGLGRIDAIVGPNVSVGYPIGTMPLNENAMLYIELRKDSMPIDPAPWFGKQ